MKSRDEPRTTAVLTEVEKSKAEKSPEIVVVIPLYNHAGTVYELAGQCLEHHARVLVVDDGSSDLTEGFFDALDLQVVTHPKNRGKGAAIMTAAREVAKSGATHIITIDADLQHNPAEIDRFKSAILQEPSAVYVGKRDFSSANVPASSRFGRKFSNFWFRVQTGRPVGDAQSGFRAYPVEVLNHLPLGEKHYSFEVEVLVKSAWSGVPVKDIPVSVFYPEREKRISHFHILADNLRLTILNTRLTIRSFLPIPHRQLHPSQDEAMALSIFHPVQSIRRLLFNRISPSTIALSGTVGIMVGTVPVLGFQTLLILFICGFFRLNKIVGIAASHICMPPLVPALCIEAGYFMSHSGRFLTDISLETIGNELFLRIFEWFLGSLVVAPVLGITAFTLLYGTAWVIKINKLSGRFDDPGKANVTSDQQRGCNNRMNSDTQKKWSSRSVGSKWQHSFFYVMIKIGGRRLAYLILYFVAAYYVLFVPSVKKKTDPYLSKRFPSAGLLRRTYHRYLMVLQLGKTLIDRAVVGILGPQAITAGFHTDDDIQKLQNLDSGFILMVSHVGCWQVAMSALNRLEKPVNLLMHLDQGDVDKHYYQHRQNSRRPFTIIDPKGFLGGGIEMLTALKNDEILCVMGDRVFGSDTTSIAVDFLGRKAPFPASAYKIASLAQKPVVFFYSYKTGPASYEIKLGDILSIPAKTGRDRNHFIPHVQAFAASLETFVEEHPFQFFNFYDMWES
ncbi:MAG: DUF2062 domain-containing protein [Desulfobacteraceae bacterium]